MERTKFETTSAIIHKLLQICLLPAVTEAYLHHGKIVKITKEVDDEPGSH